uniref:Uncharacterized protein n=1 Tax=Anopheles coluzzii TaxID=1518534 RepID=A0A8W7PEL6_ANOCL
MFPSDLYYGIVYLLGVTSDLAMSARSCTLGSRVDDCEAHLQVTEEIGSVVGDLGGNALDHRRKVHQAGQLLLEAHVKRVDGELNLREHTRRVLAEAEVRIASVGNLHLGNSLKRVAEA